MITPPEVEEAKGVDQLSSMEEVKQTGNVIVSTSCHFAFSIYYAIMDSRKQ